MVVWLLKALGVLKRVPWQAWAAIALALVVTLHLRQDVKDEKAAYARGKADTEAAFAAKAKEWQGQMDAMAATIRSKNHEANTGIVERAGAIVVRGPGKAACPYTAAPASSGSEPRSGQADAGLDRVPDQAGTALAAVPFNELVERAKVCDLNRQEVIDRRAYDAALAEWWAKASKH